MENLLIHGDNLDVLQALMHRIEEQVRCVWIDPPYNTGTSRGKVRGPGYRDRRSSAAWLDMMRPRLELLRRSLRPDGSLFVQIDDNEMDALRLCLDEIFGADCLINRITVDARAPSAFSTVNRGVFKSSEYLLWVCRDRAAFRWNPQRVARSPDLAYTRFLLNPDEPHGDWRFTTVKRACPRGADGDRFRVEHARQVCRLASISDAKAGAEVRALKARSKAAPERVLRLDREGRGPVWALRGQQLIFYDRQVSEIDGALQATRPMTNVWTDISWEGIAGEGGVRFKHGKKPERLLRRCLALASDPGDLVLDAFLGAGTTAAVAHKMGRRWIGIEENPQVNLARERLERVVAGEDATGITTLAGWSGGGSFRSLSLADLD